jgi:hypothetical protein
MHNKLCKIPACDSGCQKSCVRPVTEKKTTTTKGNLTNGFSEGEKVHLDSRFLFALTGDTQHK